MTDHLDPVRDKLLTGDRLGAIRGLRERGLSFEEAAKLTEGVGPHPGEHASPRTQSPLESSQPFPASLDRLQAVLARIATDLYGMNYAVSLDARGLYATDASAAEVWATLYPESRAEPSLFQAATFGDVLSDLRAALGHVGDEGAHPPAGAVERVLCDGVPAIEDALGELMPAGLDVHLYADDGGLPLYYVYWFFAYLLHDAPSGRWLALVGGASD